MKSLLVVFALVAFSTAVDLTFMRQLHQELGDVLKQYDSQLQDTVAFTDCGGASMTANSLTVSPWPIKAGAKENVVITGNAKAAFTITKGLLDVIFAGTTIFEDKLAFSGSCASGTTCSVTSVLPMPSMIPPGTYDLKLHLKDSADKEHVCLLFKAKI